MIYRDATPTDAEQLAALFADTFTDTFGHIYTPENLATFLDAMDEAAWARELEDPAFAIRVADDDGVLAGYIKLGPPKLPFTPRGPSAELRQLYIRPDYQGAGVSRALLDWAIAHARAQGAQDLYLSVFVENARAIRLYEKLGFERVGSYAFMVGDHADEDHVMRLSL